MRAVCKAFNIELTEVEDWNCCGATPGHTTKEELGLALPYSNLINASKQGLDNIVAPCAACYNRLKSADYSVNNSPLVKERMNQIIGEEKKRDVKIFNVLEFFRDIYGLDKLKNEVKKPLSNLNAACYYGCLLVRPSKVLQFDDEEDPQSMDQILKPWEQRLSNGHPKQNAAAAAMQFLKLKLCLNLHAGYSLLQ
jgi:heterodisulfide reductase subunit B